jgi:hypothetical protein
MATNQIGTAVGKTTGIAQTIQLQKRPKVQVGLVVGSVNASGSGQIFPTGRR